MHSASTRATKTRIGLKYRRMNGWGPVACSNRSIGIIIRSATTPQPPQKFALPARNEQRGGYDRDQQRVVQQMILRRERPTIRASGAGVFAGALSRYGLADGTRRRRRFGLSCERDPGSWRRSTGEHHERPSRTAAPAAPPTGATTDWPAPAPSASPACSSTSASSHTRRRCARPRSERRGSRIARRAPSVMSTSGGSANSPKPMPAIDADGGAVEAVDAPADGRAGRRADERRHQRHLPVGDARQRARDQRAEQRRARAP